MSREIRADYTEQLLFPPCLEDWIPEDHPSRFIRDFVDSLKLEPMGFRVRKTRTGRPNYAVDLLLKVWIYGYLEKIRSSRRLERACREHVSLLWLTGNQAPDHNTLWRFWRDNRNALKALFRQTVQVALEAELVGLVLHAIDGTKVRSAGSRERAWHRKELEELLEQAERSIEAMSQEVESRQSSESGEYRLPEELQKATQRRERIRAALEQLEGQEKKRELPTDPEARMMQCGNRQEWAYNAQAVVDRDSRLVVADGVTQQENDSHQLMPMLEETQENMGAVAEENVADAGYDCAEQFERAEQQGYEVLVNEREQVSGPYHTGNFHYDEQRNVFVCPQGQELEFVREGLSNKKTRIVHTHQCRSYRDCPVRWQCSKSKQGRRLTVSRAYGALARQREKRGIPENRQLMAQRKAIVEPVFAWIKEVLGFRRWTFRGLEKVRAQWSLLCACYNLRKLYGYWKVGKIAWG